jgi:hypothetical protein
MNSTVHIALLFKDSVYTESSDILLYMYVNNRCASKLLKARTISHIAPQLQTEISRLFIATPYNPKLISIVSRFVYTGNDIYAESFPHVITITKLLWGIKSNSYPISRTFWRPKRYVVNLTVNVHLLSKEALKKS